MIYAIVILILLIVDQGAKYLALLNIPDDGTALEFIPGIIDLIRVSNSGMAFGFLADWNLRWPLAAAAIVFSAVVIFMIARRHIKGAFGRWMAVLTVAGALGNVIDRALFGSVIDMIHFEFFPKFPVFNVADMYLVIGGIAFCFYVIFHRDYSELDPELEDGPEVRTAPPPPVSRQPKSAPLPKPLRPAVEDFMDSSDTQEPQRESPKPRQKPAASPPPPLQPDAGNGGEPRRQRQNGAPAAGTPPRRRTAGPQADTSSRPARRPAPISDSVDYTPAKTFDISEEVPEFSLEDILAEFSDKD